VLVLQIQIASTASGVATDPGVRSGAAGAGAALAGLTPNEHSYFNVGLEDFEEAEDVPDGLGPRMNLDSCAGCHIQPAVGGSSPATNPQIAFASKLGGTDRVPPFLSLNGPVREARFVRNADGTPDGGVHALFTVNGRQGAGACNLSLPDWGSQMANRNVVFRIPTPTFGAGLMEMIPDSAILGNQRANSGAKAALGIRGRANFFVSGRTISGQTNNNGNDGTIARFGWKAQNKSLLIFSGEAYNVEMGITNDLFMTERDENPACDYANNPNSITDPDAPSPIDAINSIEKFTFFMRFLAPPTPSATLPGGSTSINTGKSVFNAVGCVQCHTASFTTGKSAVAALRYKPVPLYSDLLVHDMGVGLADGVSQGSASGREFRTAPLWGLGQRIFFLHDGRSADLISAIKAHASSGSEATGSVMLYNALSEARKQDLLNFLRSL
jgi:CxxC motif-containing protein (DUF1111 family)